MKNHLKSLVLALGASLIILPAMLAGEGRPDGGPDRERLEDRMHQMKAKMAKKLDLSEEQKVQMKELAEQERTELKALHESAAPAMKEHREKMAAVHKTYQEKRLALMTPEQKETAGKMREKMGKMRDRRGVDRGEGVREKRARKN